MDWKNVLKKVGIWIGILGICGFLFYVGTAVFVRYTASQEQRSNFDCEITGKETWIVNCDKRSYLSYISDTEVRFHSPQKMNAVYIPFSDQEGMTVKLNKSLKANFGFWIVYDNYGIRELQEIDWEIFATITPENQAKLLARKANNNFWWEEGEDGQKIIINTKWPFITYKMFWPMGSKFDEFLNQGFNPKGVLIWIATKDQNEVVELSVE